MCEAILGLGLNADLVFLDDNSPDGTGAVLDELAARHKRVRVVHRAGKAGLGSAHLAGIALAYDEDYDRLVTLDCDFTHPPTLIPKFLERSEHADVVVGSRFLQEGSLPDWSLFRKFLTTFGHFLTKTMLSMAQDATGAFRVYNLRTIPRDVFSLVQSRGFSFFFESLFILSRNGHSVGEIPIALPARAYGKSKMNFQEMRRSLSTLATLFLQDQTDPARFRLSKSSERDPALVDPQNWNDYWAKKSAKTTAVYDLIATAYRNGIMRPCLEATLRREFQPGARVLHAGCGSGQVDENLHEHVRITAVDISTSALALYSRHNPRAEAVRHASIFNLPFPDQTFDGAYNLGVVEHFQPDELRRMFSEVHRILKPKGKLVVFWPHAHATSVFVLKGAHYLLNDVFRKDVHLHPPEVSLVHSKREAADLLATGGFDLTSYDFGPRDFFVQAVVVATRR
jgi:dolichol-phosphate mannosyltransferase